MSHLNFSLSTHFFAKNISSANPYFLMCHFHCCLTGNAFWHIFFFQSITSSCFQILVDDPYTPQQLLNNAVRILLQCGLYTCNFEDWDQKLLAEKIWTNLKTFIQECYTRQLNTSSITAGSHGYVQNACVTRTKTLDDDNNNVQTVMAQMTALIPEVNKRHTRQPKLQHQWRRQSTSPWPTNRQCSNSSLHSPSNTTKPTSGHRRYSHPSPSSQSPTLQVSQQRVVAAVDVVALDVVDMQILCAPVAATYAPHSQALLDAADKEDCPL